jgi:hypothetical protein
VTRSLSHNLSLGGQYDRPIENRSHYVRDVTLGEDASRIRKGGGPEIMAALRNAAIGFLRATGATNIAETIRRNASQVGKLFTKLGIFKK